MNISVYYLITIVTKNRMGSLLSLVLSRFLPDVMSGIFFRTALASGLLISDWNLHPDFCKAGLSRGLLSKAQCKEIKLKQVDQSDIRLFECLIAFRVFFFFLFFLFFFSPSPSVLLAAD